MTYSGCAPGESWTLSQLPENPVAAIARLRIDVERCRLNGRCGQLWDALEPVHDNPRIRYCARCESAVHLAEGERELDELVRMGRNVALMREEAPLADRIAQHG